MGGSATSLRLRSSPCSSESEHFSRNTYRNERRPKSELKMTSASLQSVGLGSQLNWGFAGRGEA